MSKLAKVYTRAEYGLNAPMVSVEVHLQDGLPNFSIVGLPETAVKESKDRVVSALVNNHFKAHKRRTTVSLSPANLPKKGGRFDLPIAIGLLLASEQLTNQLDLNKLEFYGELGLDGSLRWTAGLLPSIIVAIGAQKRVIIPQANLVELSLLNSDYLIPCNDLAQVCAILAGKEEVLPIPPKQDLNVSKYSQDFAQIRGQNQAKRALEIAAAGGHNVLLIGTPGAGKTMLAERLPSIMPPIDKNSALEKLSIFSIAGESVAAEDMLKRTFRSPHHSASAIALVGGGSNIKPGEISLAHHGVLFLDELPEFPRHTLEVLRQPLENGYIHLSRASGKIRYPARFQLIAAMNPCPCGYLGDIKKVCYCSAAQVAKYRHKISGPLLDRIDMVLNVPALTADELLTRPSERETTSTVIAKRVYKAYNIGQKRQGKLNSHLSNTELENSIDLTKEDKNLLEAAMDRLSLSARSYYRILRVARTIADLDGQDCVNTTHLSEAINYRRE